MTDIKEWLRDGGDPIDHEAADAIERLEARIEELETALARMLNDSMYKDHPEASEMAKQALRRSP